MLVVSLSSIPPRFSHLGATLRSILDQRRAPDRVLLFIPRRYRRFPDWDGTLPQVPAGVEIVRCEQDLGPATKVLPAADALHGMGVELLFCDDDRIYPADWTQGFVDARARHPQAALCMRGMMVGDKTGRPAPTPEPVAAARPDWQKWIERHVRRRKHDRLFRRSGHVDMFEGCGGVMVRPEMFDISDQEIPDIALGVDDVWLSGRLTMRGTPIWLIANRESPPRTAAHDAEPLARDDRHQRNVAAIRYMQEKYGIWT